MVHRVLRRCGAFFVCRGGGQQQARGDTAEMKLLKDLRACLLSEYVRCIARRYGVFELFLEGGRSKTGLLLPPKRGILTTVLELVLKGPALDVTLVPISISYDKILEAETFPQELLGEPKKAELQQQQQQLLLLQLHFLLLQLLHASLACIIYIYFLCRH
ncbi:hypothetical protein Emed_002204 [Eimeria media]